MPPVLITVVLIVLGPPTLRFASVVVLPTMPPKVVVPAVVKVSDWVLAVVPSIVELKLILPFDPVPVLVRVVKA